MGKNSRDDEGFSLEDYFKDDYEEDKENKEGKEYYRTERRKRFGKEEDNEVEVEELESKVDRRLNKVLDYFESKQFTALQWSVSVGVLVLMWGVMYMMTSVGKNVRENAEYQEENSSSFVAKDIASEQYIEYEEEVNEREMKEEDDEQYKEKINRSYEEQKEALGEIPEDYVAIMDDNGVLSYLSPEDYRVFIDSEEGMSDMGGDEVVIEDLPIDIVPADDSVWENINYGDLSQLDKEDVYQTRGEYLYYAQRVISIGFPNQVIDSDIDTESFVLTIYENPYAKFELPEDFEERMHFAFDNSGYGHKYGGQLEIVYEEGTIQ